MEALGFLGRRGSWYAASMLRHLRGISGGVALLGLVSCSSTLSTSSDDCTLAVNNAIDKCGASFCGGSSSSFSSSSAVDAASCRDQSIQSCRSGLAGSNASSSASSAAQDTAILNCVKAATTCAAVEACE